MDNFRLTKINICEKLITYKLHINFISKKDPVLKEEFHTNNKKYGNLLSTLMKKGKQVYYDKYFERNWNDIKNTWEGVKSPTLFFLIRTSKIGLQACCS